MWGNTTSTTLRSACCYQNAEGKRYWNERQARVGNSGITEPLPEVLYPTSPPRANMLDAVRRGLVTDLT